MKARLGAVVGLAVVLAALAGCDPLPTESGKASMSISLGSEGGADVQLILGGQTQSRVSLLRAGDPVAAALFPHAVRRSVGVDGNGGGYPFVHIHAAGVYQRGRHPVVTLDTQPALAVLASMGYRSVDVDISAPGVPATARWRNAPGSAYGNHWSWPAMTPGGAPPIGTIELNPRPWRGLAELGFVALSLASLFPAVLGLRRRRRLLAAAATVVAWTAAPAYVITAGVGQPDNLGVAGLVNGLELTIIKWLAVPGVLAAVAALCLFVVTCERARPRAAVQHFNAPPGWPPAPPGWRPYLGWQPDPAWPPPPPNWPFYPPPNPYQPPNSAS